ncbi:MAG: fibronectin type III domain-containing protein, partial [Gemmatimonadales bacterium]|nr:fibronectin type III domain-containing protein [Gemmatimonadales bacterium]
MSMLLSVVAGQGGIKVPGAPGTLSLSAGSPAHSVIDLSWSAPSDDGGATISGYRIKKDGVVLVADTSSTGTTYSATGLTASTSYNFNVAAINEKGTGADGNTPSLSTAADPAVAWTATGGYTSGTSGSYSWIRWTSSGSFTITSNTTGKTFTQYIVAGGGGGAGGDDRGNGGGGGGGARELTGQSMANTTHTITIGAGGAGSTYNGVAGSG